MKRKTRLMMATAMVLCSSVLFSSCIGSFSLFNKLLSWNRNVSDKWINELLFIVISPAYAVAGTIDVLILNSLEFWTGDNPASAQVQTIEGEDGIYTVTTDTEGHKIQKEGSDEIVEFRFDKKDQSWTLLTDELAVPLFKMIDESNALVYLADGSTMTISADQAGLYALQQVVTEKAFFAAK
ncbi:DUF3332 domain-containing protein [Bacteroidales bacterium OttesenSCG-928-M11]|nr:DUF3332 domain-containing protein [Bacteroidales bacterium OttesenSCG-928-M11]